MNCAEKIIRANNLLQFMHQVTIELKVHEMLLRLRVFFKYLNITLKLLILMIKSYFLNVKIISFISLTLICVYSI